jgi:hypothetical protein
MSDSTGIIAERWVTAERARKVKQRDSKLAWLLAFKSGVRIEVQGDGQYEYPRSVIIADTDKQRDALTLAQQSKTDYLKAARYAGALRAALSRSVESQTTEPNREIARRFEELCASELIESLPLISKATADVS